MTAVKPEKHHPWHEDIQSDVDRAKLRARIVGIRKRIDDLKSELRILEGRLSSGTKRKPRK